MQEVQCGEDLGPTVEQAFKETPQVKGEKGLTAAQVRDIEKLQKDFPMVFFPTHQAAPT